MTVPTKITDHSDKAVARLPAKFKGKPKIEAMFRSKASGRVDIIKVEGAHTYTVTIDGTGYDYVSGLFDTASDIADGLVSSINVGPNVEAVKLSATDDYLYLKAKVAATAFTLSTSGDNLRDHRIGIVDQIQEIEDVLSDLLLTRSLDTAEGRQLDLIGVIVGLSRAGDQSDAAYRILLGVQITRNLSQGEVWRFIDVLRSLTESTTVKVLEYFPAHVHAIFDGSVPAGLLNLMDGILAGGVSLSLVNVDPTNPFATEGYGGNGFGSDEAPGSGGIWAGQVT